VNSLPKTVTRQRRRCGFTPGPTAPESSTLTTRLPIEPPVGTTGPKLIFNSLSVSSTFVGMMNHHEVLSAFTSV